MALTRSEAGALGVAALGHLALFGLLSVGFLATPNPDLLKPQPIEVAISDDIGMEALDGDAGLRAVRVVGQAFGSSVEAVNDYTELFIGALAGVELTFDGHRTTQLRVELDPTPPVSDPDLPGVLGSTVTLTAFATEETA